MITSIRYIILLVLISIMVPGTLLATEISGRVMDQQGEPLTGVNVYLKDTYSGGTTDLEGYFQFQTDETGNQVLILSMVGYKTLEQSVNLDGDITGLSLEMKDDINKLNAVVISAGSFEASDEKKSEILKPLDIAMTAGATADIAGALSKLPGTTTNGESGRLFVRGGTANETQAFIDGVMVRNFYSPSANNMPTRVRFSPFLFKGTFFSTGGYSAEYGQGLSSVLSLNSNDVPPETQTDISLMSVGADVSHTQKWDDGSIFGQVQYTNLDPYQSIIRQEFEWINGFTSGNGTFMLRKKDKNHGMWKVYANIDRSGFSMIMPNIDSPDGDRIEVTNDNLYINTTYKYMVAKNTTGFLGLSYGQNQNDLDFNDLGIFEKAKSAHAKAYLVSDLSGFSVKAGAEVISDRETQSILFSDGSNFNPDYENHLVASFLESDLFLSRSITLRTGLRYTRYSLFNQGHVSPRISMAVKTGPFSQLSAAVGQFHQLPERDLLLMSTEVSPETADHYILSWQTTPLNRVFRIEAYYKDYNQLVKFNAEAPFDPSQYNNTGRGYAQGVDLFWRDSKTFKNTDYWVSYSYIDTERDFRDTPSLSPVTFAAKHNTSLVVKHFVTELKTQFGASYSFNSGRPYQNPNLPGFNQARTRFYSDLSFNFAFLHRQNIILYGSITNLLGRDNIFGYEFEQNAGPDNHFDSRAIGQPAKRFLFLGLFITLTKNNEANQLENL